MNSREAILAAVKRNQPPLVALPEHPVFGVAVPDVTEKFSTVLQSIGGSVIREAHAGAVQELLQPYVNEGKRIVTLLNEYELFATLFTETSKPHLLEDVEVAIIRATLAVAENGSVWVPDSLLPVRVLPFICQQLVAVVEEAQIVPTMHEAYKKIADANYGFGTFIAGPSKTADIEQSLVLGAHGPKTMTIILRPKTTNPSPQ